MQRLVRFAVLAVLMASCGGGTGIGADTVVVDDLMGVADRTVEKKSARMSFALRMEGLPGFDRPLIMTGESQAQLTGLRQRTEVDFPLLLLGEEGAGDRTQPMTMIIDGSIVYMNMPFLAEAVSSPTTWIRMDLEHLPPGAEDLRSLATGQNDPSQVINYLRGATGDFRKTGEAELKGVATTRYRGTVDLDLAAERAPEDVRESVEASRSQVEAQIGITKLPTDVWVDDEGLVRRVQYEYPLPMSSQGRMTITTDLFDFGIMVDVTAPPDDQVTDLEDLAPE